MELSKLRDNRKELEVKINNLIKTFELENNVEISSLYLSRVLEMPLNEDLYTATSSYATKNSYKDPDVKISITI